MNAKHTPGPWIDGGPAEGGSCRIVLANSPLDGNAFNLARLYGVYSEREANAKLIAAAPDLLDACEICLGFLEQQADFGLDVGWEIDRVKAAIAKAKGGAQ